MRLLLLALLSYPIVTTSCAPKTINVLDFGAKGDGITDNSQAFIKAFQYCVERSAVCYIPKAKESYLVEKTIYIPLEKRQKLTIESNGAIIQMGKLSLFQPRLLWKLTPMYDETTIFSFGPKAATGNLTTAFQDNNRSTSVMITGLSFVGPGINLNKSNYSQKSIVSALDISTEGVILKNLSFENFRGYGVRSFGASNIMLTNISMANVGGRGNSQSKDAFGDAIYIGVLKDKAKVSIDKCKLSGAVINNRRSRDGITFEFSTASYTASIIDCDISNYAKAVHIEDQASANIKVTKSRLSHFNYAIAMVGNKRSILNVYGSTILCSGTDGVDHGDGGPIINTNGGGQINFYNSTIDLNGRKHAYITMVGVDSLKDCVIKGNNKNPFFADANCIFSNCQFIDFGGPLYSFFSYGKGVSTFKIINSKFLGGGTVDAQGQRVNLIIENASSSNLLKPQVFQK